MAGRVVISFRRANLRKSHRAIGRMAGLGDDHFRHEQRYTSPVVLFDGRDLKNFDIFLKNRGLNNDPEQVFRVENGVIHISGKELDLGEWDVCKCE